MGEIVKYQPGQSLTHAVNLWQIRGDSPEFKHLRTRINHAWPGDVDPQVRDHRTFQLIEEMGGAIASSERPDSILQCCWSSVVDTLTAAASMDLSVQKAFGEAYLVPFKGVLTLMVGYRGFIKLLVNTGFVTHCESVVVYQADEFTLWRDETGPHWTHKPDLRQQGQAAAVVGCYAVGYTRGAAPIFEYMNVAELGKVKSASAGVRSGKPTPYTYWETEMMRKAPLRRLSKYIPKTADNLGYELLARAADHDNKSFDLEGYAEAQATFKEGQQKAKALQWDKAATAPAATPAPAPAKPAGPDPNDESTWPKDPDTGDAIPPQFWSKQDSPGA